MFGIQPKSLMRGKDHAKSHAARYMHNPLRSYL